MAANARTEQKFRIIGVKRDQRQKLASYGQRLAPWLGGAGIALGHIAASVNCTVPQQGRCGACGSCVLVVGSLVGWAWAKRKRADDFYLDDGSSFS